MLVRKAPQHWAAFSLIEKLSEIETVPQSPLKCEVTWFYMHTCKCCLFDSHRRLGLFGIIRTNLVSL